MAKKKIIVKKVPEKSKPIWAGANLLLGKAKNQQEQQERQLINLVAQVLQVSPFGVNVLGGQPYINNLGLKQKKEKYGRGTQFDYDWKQIAIDDEMKAVVMVRIVDDKGKALMPYIIGEASTKTIRMKTLLGYQNHLAQTRGENRAIRHLYGVRIHEDMLVEIGKRIKQPNVDAKMLQQTAGATNASYEEMQPPTSLDTDPEKKRYDLTIARVEEIKDDEIKLKEALGKINQLALSDTKRKMIKAMIQSYLKQLRK